MQINEQPTIVISSGQTASAAKEIGRFVRGSVTVPGTMTGTTLAFHVCNDLAGTYKAVEIEGNEVNPVTFAAGKAYRIPNAAFNYAYLKLVSGSAEASDRTFTCFFIAQ